MTTTRITTTKHSAALASRHAFSLLELTLVLLIIGLLGAVAAVNLAGAGEKAKIKATKATMRIFKTQITIYASEKNVVPTTLNDLITGKYVDPDNSGNPPSDGWDQQLYYRPTPGGAREFDLISAGADMELETPDDINLWDPSFDN